MLSEYNDFFNELGALGTASYKFFDSFKFDSEETTIKFHTDFEYTLDEELFEKLRTYVKHEKSAIRKQQKKLDVSDVKQKMMFFFIKLQEYGVFSVSERKYILIYTDFCLDRLV
jgi:hypothetical protein